MRFRSIRVCSSAWLERTPDKGEVGGSSPPRPTNFPFKMNTLRVFYMLYVYTVVSIFDSIERCLTFKAFSVILMKLS